MSSQRNVPIRWASLAIVILAGAWTLFHIIWNIAEQKSDDYWGFALLILFI